VPATFKVTRKLTAKESIKQKEEEEFDFRPRLYVLSVGAANYSNKKITKLTYPAKDATDFANTVRRQEGALYKQVEIKLLIDQDATQTGILQGLEWLQKQVTKH
ncbi:hypothetical protein, partial [Undibacterium sp. Di24W]